MISTPVFMRTMIDHPTFAGTDRSSVRLFSLGGAGVAPAMVREGAREFDCWCKRTYGSTEYPTLTTGRLGDDPEHDATTDGVLIGAAELRIVDPQTLADVAPRRTGRAARARTGDVHRLPRLGARCRRVHRRTGGSAPATSRVYDGEYLTIVDRLKDIIIRGGENISAQEVEAAARDASRRRRGRVRRRRPTRHGREGVRVRDPACRRARRRSTSCARTCSSTGLARFKLPERLELRADLPRTASGKVQKAPLRAEQR